MAAPPPSIPLQGVLVSTMQQLPPATAAFHAAGAVAIHGGAIWVVEADGSGGWQWTRIAGGTTGSGFTVA